MELCAVAHSRVFSNDAAPRLIGRSRLAAFASLHLVSSYRLQVELQLVEAIGLPESAQDGLELFAFFAAHRLMILDPVGEKDAAAREMQVRGG